MTFQENDVAPLKISLSSLLVLKEKKIDVDPWKNEFLA